MTHIRTRWVCHVGMMGANVRNKHLGKALANCLERLVGEE